MGTFHFIYYFFIIIIIIIAIFYEEEQLNVTSYLLSCLTYPFKTWAYSYRKKIGFFPLGHTPILNYGKIKLTKLCPKIVNPFNLLNSLSAKKKRKTKFMSANFQKIWSPSYIILRIQRLEDKQWRATWGGSWWATSSRSMLFANYAIFISQVHIVLSI